MEEMAVKNWLVGVIKDSQPSFRLYQYMPAEDSVPPQYKRVRISTVDDDVLLNKMAELEETTTKEIRTLKEEIRSLKELIRQLVDNAEQAVSR